jgi:hypothetical protein
MNSNQRSQENNQSDNGANEKSPPRGVTADKNNLNQSQQSGTLHGDSQQQGAMQPGPQSGSMGARQSTDRAGSQTAASRQQQEMPSEGVHQSNDLAGGLPRSPAGKHLSADQNMDDDTGLSNRANRQPAEIDDDSRQGRQSNVGRRDDGTPD